MGRKQLRRVGKPLSVGTGAGDPQAGSADGTWWKWLCRCCLLALAFCAGLLHRHHVAFIYENERHVSHLSTLERELMFRTEMGFYYSFFKQLITAPSARTGLATLLADNKTEFPDQINALRRFNLYPELCLASLYRAFIWFADHIGWRVRDCYMVERGGDMPRVESCVGPGDPACFYVECVFALSGLLIACLFLLGCEVAEGRIWGGLLATCAYFFNHRESTRVQWTPPLRESFSYPLFMAQQLLLVRCLRRRPGLGPSGSWWLLTGATVAFMLPWQFAQFALLTQSLSLFAAHMLGYLPARFFRHIAHALLAALGAVFLLQCGNAMLLTSFYAAALITMLALAHAERFFHRLGHPLLAWSAQVGLLGAGTLTVRRAALLVTALGETGDDAHISQLLMSKFTSFRSFHTLLYTCAAEFDFMPVETLWQLSYTLLLPAALLASVLAFVRLLVDAYHKMRSVVVFQVSHRGATQHQQPHANGTGSGDPPSAPVDGTSDNDGSAAALQQQKMDLLYLRGADVVFLLCQLAAFTVMAALIMRLKLFWTPQLCLTCALLARPGWLRVRSSAHSALLALLLGGMAVKGWQNLQTEWSAHGEFSNWSMEHLVLWVREHTRPGDAFAGTMPTMATIRLTTGRPIINHPHYEDEGLRQRTRLIYSMYSRKSAEEVWRIYRNLQVRYTIVEPGWCYRSQRPGCSLPEMWDLEDSANRGQRPLCDRLLLNEAGPQADMYFRKVFENNAFKVYRVWPGGGPVVS